MLSTTFITRISLFIAAIFAIFYILSQISTTIQYDTVRIDTDNISMSSVSSIGSYIRKCILGYLDDDQITKMTANVNLCVANHSRITEKLLFALDSGFNELKYFLHMHRNSTSNCNFVTIGIGSSSSAERQFIQLYPQCKIFGIEASTDAYGDFAQIGQILPYAVGVKAANISIRLFIDRQWIDRVVPVLPLDNVLIEHVGTKTIDFATIDLEGVEIPILEGLFNDGRLTIDGLTFCQLDAEIHPIHYGTYIDKQFSFLSLWKGILTNSPYLPIHVEDYNVHARKISMINVRNAECNRRFRFDKYMLM